MKFDKIEELIEDVRAGKMVVLVDDEDRENEGDLVLAAEFANSENINFMAKEARGLICLAMAPEQIDRLNLPMMVRDEMNLSPNKTAFTVSIEAAQGVTTGISAADRAHTIRIASDPKARPQDVHTPGHIFPIRAQNGGVLKRPGHTEGSVDLALLAGLRSAAVICEVMNEDGTMARVGDLAEFARKHQLKIGTIVDLIQYRMTHQSLVDLTSEFSIPATQANGRSGMSVKIFTSRIDGTEHLVIQKGVLSNNEPTMVRVHLDNFTKEVFSILKSSRSDLEKGLQFLSNEPSGVLLILRGNNTKVGLSKEVEKYFTGGFGASIMDQLDYGIGAQILAQLGINKIRLLSNHPEKKVGIRGFHLEIVETIPW